MAAPIGSGYFGDATGGIGQGLAFVLPQGKADEYAMQLAQTHATQLQAVAKAKQAQAFREQLEYQKEFSEQKLPEAFAPFDKELNNRFNKWQQDAADFHVKTGKSPFTDPDLMKRYNDEVVVPARQSKELGEKITKLMSDADLDKGNKYTDESKKAVADFYNKMKSDPFGTLNQDLPQLQERPPSGDDLVNTLKPTTDPSNNKAQVFSAAMGDPKYHDLLKGYGYNPDLPDFGVYTDPSHPRGKRVWYTNTNFTNHQADLILQNPDDTKSKQVLSALGIDPVNDRYAKEKLQHAISDQNAAMGKFVSDYGRRLDSEVDPEKFQQIADQKQNEKFRAESLNIAWEHLSLDREKENREATKSKEPVQKPSNILLNNMKNQLPNSGENLLTLAPKGQYGKREPHINIDPKNGDHIFSFPAQIHKLETGTNAGEMAEKFPAKTYHINPNSPTYNSQVRQMAKEQNIDLEYIDKQGYGNNQFDKADKGVSQQQQQKPVAENKVLTDAKINSMIGKKGYEGYTKKELIDYYKGLGYTIK